MYFMFFNFSTQDFFSYDFYIDYCMNSLAGSV